ncbi:MAG TPA: ABC transporter substrate-binding protein [Candidatus Nanoarchaeia archaeon]|nr:ABC transporter substrate-binding protein [Candidatus Nanoarchaeia archaeon]
MKTLAAIMVLLLVLASCSSTTPSDTLTLGSILILSGEGSAWGAAEQHGIDMAVAEINAQGGILGKRVNVIHQDDVADAKKALSAFGHLVDTQGVKFIIGTTWSRSGLALVDPAKDKGVVMISPSLGVKDFNEAHELMFNTWPHDFILSRVLADHVFAKGHRNVALIGAQEVWVKDQTTAFVERFEELGGSIVVLVEPLPTDTVVSTEVLKIVDAHKRGAIDAIVSTTDGVLVGTLVAKGLVAHKVKLPLYSITIDQATIDAADGAYEGMEFLTSLTPDPAFEARYNDAFGIPIDIGADSAYDAVMMLAESMRATKSTDTHVVATHLRALKNYDGMSGTLVSDSKGGFTKDFAFKKIVDGKAIDLA